MTWMAGIRGVAHTFDGRLTRRALLDRRESMRVGLGFKLSIINPNDHRSHSKIAFLFLAVRSIDGPSLGVRLLRKVKLCLVWSIQGRGAKPCSLPEGACGIMHFGSALPTSPLEPAVSSGLRRFHSLLLHVRHRGGIVRVRARVSGVGPVESDDPRIVGNLELLGVQTFWCGSWSPEGTCA